VRDRREVHDPTHREEHADDQRRQALLPLLLHPQPEKVCCLALATGHTAGAVLAHDPPVEVDVVELSPTVVRAARENFQEAHLNLFAADRANVFVEDARTFIAASPDSYDLVIGDLYRPYGAGEGKLYSVEHFRNVRRSLRPGGIFCQWLPAHQLTEQHLAIIAASFADVFPDGKVMLGNRDRVHPVIGLLGTKDAATDIGQVSVDYRQRIGPEIPSDALLSSSKDATSLLLGSLVPGELTSVPRNTLDNALIEIEAGRRRVLQSSDSTATLDAYLKGDAWDRFLQRPQSWLDNNDR